MSQEFQATESEQKVFLRKVLQKQTKNIPGKPSSPQLQITDIRRPTAISPKSLPPIRTNHHSIREQPEQVPKIQILKATRIDEGASQTIEKLRTQPIEVEHSQVFIDKVTLKHQAPPEPQKVSLPKPKPAMLPTIPICSRILPKELPQIDKLNLLIEASKDAIKEQPRVETKIEEEVKPSAPGTGISVGVLPNFYELFLECIEGGRVEGAFSSGKPVILVLSDSGDKFGETVQIICQEIYKERPGGWPGFEVASTEEGKTQIEMFKEPRLIFIDESEDQYYVRNDKDKEAWEKICDRITEFASVQETGFFIFNIREDEATKFYYRLKGKFPSIPEIYLLKMRNLSLELKERIASLTWGLTEITNITDIIKEKGKPRLQTFDDFFSRAKKRFENCLEGVLKEKDCRYFWVTQPNRGEESPVHFQLKAFIVRYYVKEQRLEEKGQEESQIADEIRTQIPTEYELNKDIIADVYSRRDSVAIEAETLYEGELGRLKKTLTKYKGKALPLRIILSNLTFLRHFKELKALKEKHYRNMNLDFWALDLKEGRPIPLSEIEEKTRELRPEIKTIQKPN